LTVGNDSVFREAEMQCTSMLNNQIFAIGVRQRSVDGFVLNPVDNLVLYVFNQSNMPNRTHHETVFQNSSVIIPQVWGFCYLSLID
jgi:hypothetical protein